MANINQVQWEDFKKLYSKIKSNAYSRKTTKVNISFEHLSTTGKITLIRNLFLSNRKVESINFGILSWEPDAIIEKAISLNNKKNILNKISTYKNGKKPGFFFISDHALDNAFLSTLLTNHFNFEKGARPALNIKVLIYLVCSNCKFFIDIYDDRGLNFYYIPKN